MNFYSILPWISVFKDCLPSKNNHGRKRETGRWICTNNSWSEINLASSDNIRKGTKTICHMVHVRHLICSKITWASLSIFDIGLWFFINLCRLRSSEIQKHSIEVAMSTYKICIYDNMYSITQQCFVRWQALKRSMFLVL